MLGSGSQMVVKEHFNNRKKKKKDEKVQVLIQGERATFHLVYSWKWW